MKFYATLFVAAVLTSTTVSAQNTVTADASSNWIAFMNVFNLDGGYEFGSAWGLADVKTTVDGDNNTVTLQPNFNTYAANLMDPFWVDQTTGEGAKVMEASTFVEPGDSFNGNDLTFVGSVQSFTLDTNYSVKVFIKALDPNNGFADALMGAKTIDLPTSGSFSVSATADELPAGLVIQYGFSVTGRNANPDNETALGGVTVGPQSSSTNELNNKNIEAKVYPTLAQDVLNISAQSEVLSYQIMSMTGEMLLNGEGAAQVDVSALPAGNYSIILKVDEGQRALRFVKL